MIDEDNVKPIGVKFKAPPGDDAPMLKVIDTWGRDGCNHRYWWQDGRMHNVTYYLRDGETEVECSACNARLDPMFVLKILANEETQWSRNRERYIEEMRRLKERSRTKCLHCGNMTEISRR